ncbi:MAG: rane protein [Frankiales bacterium]|nr:rane protein [Frankiales bacterium]
MAKIEISRTRRVEPRMDQPRDHLGRSWRPSYDADAFGRYSERVARFIGTGKFLIYMTVFVTVWVAWNVLLPQDLRFDRFPFIFLTLTLSLQASYAAPLILLAQNRQADRDRVSQQEDRARNERSVADMEYLAREVAAIRISMGDVATRDFIRQELQRLREDVVDDIVEADDNSDIDRPQGRSSA